jgi:hypothetical protein
VWEKRGIEQMELRERAHCDRLHHQCADLKECTGTPRTRLQYMKYSGFVSGTDTGNQTRVECSSGKVVGAVSGTLIQRGEEVGSCMYRFDARDMPGL